MLAPNILALFLSLFQIIQTELSIPSLCQLVVSCSESKAFAQSCWCTFHFCIVINTDFFGLQLEASFLNLVYFHGMYLLVNRQYKNYRIYIGAALWNHFHFPRLFYLGFTLFYSLILCKTLPKLSKGVRKSCQVLPKQCPSHPQVIPKLSPGSAQDVPKSSSVMPSRTQRYTCSQQMSPVIAFIQLYGLYIAVVAQKVKVQC